MLLKNPELEIPEKQPFKNDALSRQESSDTLKEFVRSANESLVICLDSPWGQGKTTFLKMWEQDLKNNNFPTLYFNAWKNDFSDDALTCMIGELSESINSLSNTNQPQTKQYLEKAKVLSLSFLKNSIPVATKIATAGLLDLDEITEESLASFSEKIARERIEHYSFAKNNIEEFKETLTKLVKSLNESSEGSNSLPLIFIIDELDRCRPNFAVEILEKAKHLFNIENIIFILGADKTQLGISVQSIYGSGLDVNSYLRRFIDFDYLLPPPKKEAFVSNLFNRFQLISYFEKDRNSKLVREGKNSLSMFSELFEIFDLKLRDQERCCSLLSLSIKINANQDELHPILLCFLIVLKVKKPSLYKDFITNNLKTQVLLKELQSNPKFSKMLSNTNYGTILEAYIITCKYPDTEQESLFNHYKEKANSVKDEPPIHRAQRLLRYVHNLECDDGVGILPYLIQKIELSSNFYQH